jgi:hypothetical protein
MGSGNVTERRRQQPLIGVSTVILALGGGARPEFWLPLVRRVRQPFLGDWALPGGGVQANRSLEESAYEALASTTDLRPSYLEQLYTFGDAQRSHEGLPMISVVYWALVGTVETQNFHEANNVAWFAENDLPELAFDHDRIIAYALERLRSKIDYPDIVAKLVGPTFTLAQLHDVYEAVSGSSIDLANFRRRMLASGQLEATDDKVRYGRQRPATLYRYAGTQVGSDDMYSLGADAGANEGDNGESSRESREVWQRPTAFDVMWHGENGAPESDLEEVLSVLSPELRPRDASSNVPRDAIRQSNFNDKESL